MKKRGIALAAALLFCLLLPLPASANSAEPPCLTVLVMAPPEDLSLTIEFDGAQGREPQRLSGTATAWERYYRFYGSWDLDPEGLTGARLVVETGGEAFSLPIDPAGFTRYNNLLTLDLANRSLLYGQPWWRQPLLVLLRVALTLLIEGLVFLLFGYRQKRSWLVFLIVNLITQLFVNLVVLFLAGPLGTSYMGLLLLFIYLPMELAVMAAEIGAFRKLLREMDKTTSTIYAVMSNILSWVLGGFLILGLPM